MFKLLTFFMFYRKPYFMRSIKVVKIVATILAIGAVILSFTSVSTESKASLTEKVALDASQSLTTANKNLNKSQQQALTSKLANTIGVEVQSIDASPIAGLYEIATDQGLFYSSADGKYLLQGQLFSLGKHIANLTDRSLAKMRVKGMAKFSKNMIVFPAKKQKYVITVFTDNTCGYCRKLHSQMKELNDSGITVRYLAYPRQGIKNRQGQFTQNFKDMRSIWCADDPQKTMDDTEHGKAIPYRICDKPVAAQYNFGRQVGVSGTPSIMFSNGYMMPGYRPPADILALLQSMQAQM